MFGNAPPLTSENSREWSNAIKVGFADLPEKTTCESYVLMPMTFLKKIDSDYRDIWKEYSSK
jgi:hypothetical protein